MTLRPQWEQAPRARGSRCGCWSSADSGARSQALTSPAVPSGLCPGANVPLPELQMTQPVNEKPPPSLRVCHRMEGTTCAKYSWQAHSKDDERFQDPLNNRQIWGSKRGRGQEEGAGSVCVSLFSLPFLTRVRVRHRGRSGRVARRAERSPRPRSGGHTSANI